MNKTRIERDSMGELQVPVDALYGAQTQRAVNNFPISGKPMPVQFIRALILAKAAAARANVELKQISESQGTAIVDAALGLCAIERVHRHLKFAHAVAFNACLGHQKILAPVL